MLIDWNLPILDLDGDPIKQPEIKKGVTVLPGEKYDPAKYYEKTLTLYDIARLSVLAEPEQSKPAWTPDQKATQYATVFMLTLAKKDPAVDVPVDDIGYIMEKIKENMPTLLMGSALSIIRSFDKSKELPKEDKK